MKGISIIIKGGETTDQVALSALIESALAEAFTQVDNRVSELDADDIRDPKRVRAVLNLAARHNPALLQTIITIEGESDGSGSQ